MKKWTKRISLVVLCLITFFATLTFTGCERYKKLDDGSYAIVKYTSSEETVWLPTTHKGNPVTRIEECAISCKNATTIYIPKTITSIGSSAFSGCDNLTDVYFMGDLAGWCAITFDDWFATPMDDARHLYLDNILLEGEITIPKSVTEIKSCTFLECDDITSVILHDGITSIGEEAFRDCDGLKEITIPDSVVSMGGMVFEECPSSLTIYCDFTAKPIDWSSSWAGAYYVAKNVFWIGGAKGGTTPDGFQWTRTSQQAVIIVKYNGNATEVTVPDTIKNFPVTNIGYAAFSGKKDLTNVILPKTLKYIESEAFYGCEGLKDLVLPDGVASVGNSAFYGCKGLTTVSCSAALEIVGKYAFKGCSALEWISLPGSVTNISEEAFAQCPNLTIWCEMERAPSGWISGWNGSAEIKWISGGRKGTTSDGFEWELYRDYTVTIKKYKGENIAVVVPEKINGFTVTTIGESAFCEKTQGSITGSITSVSLPDTIVEIGKSAFSGCFSLKTINIPWGITRIEEYAFEDCWKLISINIPTGVTFIGDYAFYCCETLSNVTIPEGVSSIGESAFAQCHNLKSVVIPNSVTAIGQKAFYWSALKNVYYKGTAKEWENIVIGDGNDLLISATRHYQ